MAMDTEAFAAAAAGAVDQQFSSPDACSMRARLHCGTAATARQRGGEISGRREEVQ
jgi:hypothetical protein